MNKLLKALYEPGKRRNSFYEDMPISYRNERGSTIEGSLKGFSYHIDVSTGKLIKERIS